MSALADVRNLDLGRPLVRADIVGADVWPISKTDEGCYCYLCVQEHNGSAQGLEPLRASSGVFTSKVTCDMDAPVWVCLDHIPVSHREFEDFTPEVQQQLRELSRKRDGGF